MIKITVSDKTKEINIDYPALMISDSGQIIMAIGESYNSRHLTGFNVNGVGYDIGLYSDSLVESEFKLFVGEITLSN